MKKVLFLLCCLPLLQLACNRDNCKDSRFFNVTGIRIIPKEYPEKNREMTDSKTLYSQDSVLMERFYLDGYLQADYHARTGGFSFLPAAYASDCASPGYDGSQEQIADVYLIARGYYSNFYQPGDTLRNAIQVNDKPLRQYIAENQPNLKEQYFTIRLTERPNRKFLQAFTVGYRLTNGEKYEVITPPIRIY